MPELIWYGKYDKDGQRTAPVRIALPFQTAFAFSAPSDNEALAWHRSRKYRLVDIHC